jgi:hypothetical protein
MPETNTICSYPEKAMFSLTSECGLSRWHRFRRIKDIKGREFNKKEQAACVRGMVYGI